MSKRVLKHTQRTTAIMVALYVFIVLLAAVSTMLISSRGNLLDAVKLASSHQQENFTELYFLKPSQLPQYSPTGKTMTIEFHIQNVSNISKTYKYNEVLQSPNSIRKTFGTISVPADSGKSIPYSYSIPVPNEKVEITISIPSDNEYLTFRSQS